MGDAARNPPERHASLDRRIRSPLLLRLFIAALSFLGLGIQPPTADWGSMVRENANLIQFAAYDIKAALTPLLPATTIALLTIAVNFMVDWFLHHTSGIKDE